MASPIEAAAAALEKWNPDACCDGLRPAACKHDRRIARNAIERAVRSGDERELELAITKARPHSGAVELVRAAKPPKVVAAAPKPAREDDAVEDTRPDPPRSGRAGTRRTTGRPDDAGDL